MKRHISIFAFLLGVFAAVGPFAARAAVRVTGEGIFRPGSEAIDDSQDAKDCFVPSGTSQVYEFMMPWTNTVNVSNPGWAVDCWLEHRGDKIQGEFKWVPRTDFNGKTFHVYSKEELEEDSREHHLAVKFKYILLDIAFKGGAGVSGSMDPMTGLNIDSEFTLSANEFTKTGYHFAGWKTNETEGVIFADKATLTGSAFWNGKAFDSTLYAQWAMNVHSVSCELNGGAWSAGYNPPANALYDTVFSLPVPHRAGYDFIGWKVTGLDDKTARWGTTKSPSSVFEENTLCFNGEKDVYFKNLNPTENAIVTLTAQWQAATIRVTFNNHGGSSGGGIKDTLDVTYNAAYDALNPPTKGGNVFLGYEIDGVPYWNDEGQPVKSVWDIPTNCTADAKWNKLAYQLTYNENRSDGQESKVEVRDFEYGKPTKLYDGADFSNLGCTQLGWSTNSKATKPDDGCEIGGTAIFVDSKTLYAVWEKNYFIAYDGNGATNETPMAVQKLVFGQPGQSLNPNIYGKVGYTFDGWATNRAAALLLDRAYKDREIITKDLATTVGETNTLYAIWKTNTYYVAFDPNGGTGTPMGVRECKYDQPVTLPKATYDHGAYDFFGWSNDVEKVIYTDLAKPVSNLCAIADGTNTLYAVWKLAPLSAAMHCTTLRWESIPLDSGRINAWEPAPTGAGVRQYGERSRYQEWLVAQMPTNGTLSFVWRPVACDGEKFLTYWISATTNETPSLESVVNLKGNMDEWNSCVIEDVPANQYVLFYVSSTWELGYCDIDRMTWTPGGPEPVDGKDNVDISSAGISADGKFVLSFQSDERFDYNLLTNADLLGGSWGVMGEKKIGDGSILTFEPKIIEGQSQLFYKVETIQKK